MIKSKYCYFIFCSHYLLEEHIYGCPGTNSVAFTHSSGDLGDFGISGGVISPVYFLSGTIFPIGVVSITLIGGGLKTVFANGVPVLYVNRGEMSDLGLMWSYLQYNIKKLMNNYLF